MENMNSNILINHFLVNDINNLDFTDAFLALNIDIFLPPFLKGLENGDGLIFFKKIRFILEYSTLLFLLQITNLNQADNVLISSSDLGISSAAVFSILVNSITSGEEDIATQPHNNLFQIGINNYDIVHDKFNKVRGGKS